MTSANKNMQQRKKQIGKQQIGKNMAVVTNESEVLSYQLPEHKHRYLQKNSHWQICLCVEV